MYCIHVMVASWQAMLLTTVGTGGSKPIRPGIYMNAYTPVLPSSMSFNTSGCTVNIHVHVHINFSAVVSLPSNIGFQLELIQEEVETFHAEF